MQNIKTTEEFRDALTGLPKQQVFYDECKKYMAHGEGIALPFALHVFEIANVSDVIMEFGLPFGESYLKSVANRLYGALGENKLLGRIDSNRFGLLQKNIQGDGHVRYLARRVRESLSKPVDICGWSVDIVLHQGVVIYQQDNEMLDELFERLLGSLVQ